MLKEAVGTGFGLFDAFYSRFLLRDVVAKVIPGLLLLLTYASVIKSPEYIIAFFKPGMSVWMWLATFSLSWIVGFAVQSFGETFGMIEYFPRDIDNFISKNYEKRKLSDVINSIPKVFDFRGNSLKKTLARQKYYRNVISFYALTVGSPSLRLERERLLVIREACGNAYLAIIFSLITCAISYFLIENGKIRTFVAHHGEHNILVVVIIILCIAWSLHKMHKRHVNHHFLFICEVLDLTRQIANGECSLRIPIEERNSANKIFEGLNPTS